MIKISYSSYFYVWFFYVWWTKPRKQYLNNRELRNHKVLKIIISKGAQSDGTVNLESLNWEFRSSPLNELFFFKTKRVSSAMKLQGSMRMHNGLMRSSARIVGNDRRICSPGWIVYTDRILWSSLRIFTTIRPSISIKSTIVQLVKNLNRRRTPILLHSHG